MPTENYIYITAPWDHINHSFWNAKPRSITFQTVFVSGLDPDQFCGSQQSAEPRGHVCLCQTEHQWSDTSRRAVFIGKWAQTSDVICKQIISRLQAHASVTGLTGERPLQLKQWELHSKVKPISLKCLSIIEVSPPQRVANAWNELLLLGFCRSCEWEHGILPFKMEIAKIKQFDL